MILYVDNEDNELLIYCEWVDRTYYLSFWTEQLESFKVTDLNYYHENHEDYFKL